MASIEEIDKQIAVFNVEYQKLLQQRFSLDINLREIKGKITDLCKSKEIMGLLEKKNVDTAGLEVIHGKLTLTAPMPKR